MAIDHVGKIPESNGHEYIIVLTDTFSKFAICQPVKSSNAKLVAKFIFEDVICTFCTVPERIQSDRNQSFLGNVVSDLNILMRMKKVRTSGYCPSTSAVTERFTGTLIDCVSMFVNKNHNNWTYLIKPLVYAYNGIMVQSKHQPIILPWRSSLGEK